MGNYPCILRTGERVDADALYEEFHTICARDLTSAHQGQTAWSGVRIFDMVGADRVAELPLLTELLDRLGRHNVVMVNYYNMAPHSEQHEHRDQSGNLLFGISRIHIPLRTNASAVLRIERRDYHLPVGEVWAIDTSGRHAAVNGGELDRVHLVIDVKRAPETAFCFPRMTAAVYIHLAQFVAIMAWKLARDTVLQPRTIADRAHYVLRMALGKAREHRA
ncbi:aspartyl/asparaginyl beta-hydroxylase domain-containing protein [Sphingomonas sp. HF-S4]|uniref:Aspartyl/asparaginyl beta-hydroxylase domain-containing protein n=1 Tax=Sphingomonas agrestis TaxID=3080540 RepID=A0ABU3YD27_9SPHN|nr:aspartyl/asparaginyl beta-hydroxylase domain-containing protein [Sphingomonas sp. HF-S4]MDV3459082.1 aspartyl/asparaginyl beta-hydroxylase domain-containing protein [Sphingomonas sp. HF-S4]